MTAAAERAVQEDAYNDRFTGLLTLKKEGLAKPTGAAGSGDWEISFPTSGVAAPGLRDAYIQAGVTDIDTILNQIMDVRRGVVAEEAQVTPAAGEALTPRQIEVVASVKPYVTAAGLEIGKAIAADVDPAVFSEYAQIIGAVPGTGESLTRTANAFVTIKQHGLLDAEGGVPLQTARGQRGERIAERLGLTQIRNDVLLDAGFTQAQLNAADEANRRAFGGLGLVGPREAAPVPTAVPVVIPADIKKFETGVIEQAKMSAPIAIGAIRATGKIPVRHPLAQSALIVVAVTASVAPRTPIWSMMCGIT